MSDKSDPEADPKVDSENLEEMEQNMYKVEKILRKKWKRNAIGEMEPFYLVKWEGFEKLQDQTWEPIEHLQTVKQLIEEYENSLLAAKAKRNKVAQPVSKPVDTHKNTNKGLPQPLIPKQSAGTPRKLVKMDEDQVQKEKDQGHGKDKKSDGESIRREKQSRKQEKKRGEEGQRQEKSKKEASKVAEKASSKAKEEVSWGRVINHRFRPGQGCEYEVETVRGGRTVGRSVMGSSQAQKKCGSSLNVYLQEFMIEVQAYNSHK